MWRTTSQGKWPWVSLPSLDKVTYLADQEVAKLPTQEATGDERPHPEGGGGRRGPSGIQDLTEPTASIPHHKWRWPTSFTL